MVPLDGGVVDGVADGGPTGGGGAPGVGVVPGVIVPVVPGVVVGVVLPAGGVVPGVVLGVVPGVVLGVVPGVVLGSGAAVGGHSVDDADGLTVVVGGIVPGVLDEGVLGFMPGDGVIVPTLVGQLLDEVEVGVEGVMLDGVELGDCTVPVGDWDVVGFVVVVGMLGVVPGLVVLPDCAAGALVVGIAGVVPVVPDVWAAANPTQRHSAAMIERTRVIMRISPLGYVRWDGRSKGDGCPKAVL